MKHLLQQCLEALEIGRDSAYAEAQDYHQKYEGYRPLRHKALDDDVAKIESAITALKEALAKDEQAPVACWCHKCNQNVFVHGIPFSCTRMIVCPDCGNKRCPKASDHTLQCIGSNESEQSSVAVVDEVAIALRDEYPNIFNGHFTSEPMPEGTRLYTRPAQRQPLSNEEIRKIISKTEWYDCPEDVVVATENAVYEKLGIK